jgi:tetratricopeptide (TPR) repeat protein
MHKARALARLSSRGDNLGQVMRIVTACAALLLGTSLAHAGAAEDCNQVRDPERQLRGCTAYLKLGKGAPENLATAYLNRANVYAQRAKYDRAFADYAAALALDPDNPLIAYNRGNAYFDTRQYERAIADFSKAIELDARFALAYFNRGLAREGLGDTVAAAEDYRRVLDLDPAATKARKRLQQLQSQ